MLFYLFCTVTFIQLFFHWFFFSKVAFFKIRPKSQSQQHPVSVVVCARDEAPTWPETFPAYWFSSMLPLMK